MANLKLARDDLATLIEGLTPPSDAGVTYSHLGNAKAIPDGSSARRIFWMEPRQGAVQTEYGHDSAGYRHEIDLHLILTTSGEGSTGLFDAITDEAILLVNAINQFQTYSAGVDHIQADSFSVRPFDTEDVEIMISVTVVTQEG